MTVTDKCKGPLYSKIPVVTFAGQAGRPCKPSELLNTSQHYVLREVYAQPQDSPLHNVVFCAAYKVIIEIGYSPKAEDEVCRLHTG